MQVKVYTEDEQKLFRKVLDSTGQKLELALKELIEQKLDDESAIVQWLKRNQLHDIYAKLKRSENQI